jgi:hypothetical protein
VALTLAGPPPSASHWTGATMAKATGISVSSVQRIWRAHGLRPHLVRRFKLSSLARASSIVFGFCIEGLTSASTRMMRASMAYRFAGNGAPRH